MTPFLAIMVHNLWAIFRKWIVLDHTILKTLDMMATSTVDHTILDLTGPSWTTFWTILDHIGPVLNSW